MMNKFIPKAFLFTSWTLISGWLLSNWAFFIASPEKQFQLLLCFFILFIGSLVFLQPPINQARTTYLYLTLSLAFGIFLGQMDTSIFLALRFLCFTFVPLLLFAFLQAFVADELPKRVTGIKMRLIFSTSLSLIAFAFSFYPYFSLLVFYAFVYILFVSYLKRKNWLLSSRHQQILNFSVSGLLLSAFLLSTSNFSPFSMISGQSAIFAELPLILSISSLAYLLSKEYYLQLPTSWFEVLILLFVSFSIALCMAFLSNSFFLSFLQIVIGTSLSLFFIRKGRMLQQKKQGQAQKEFLFEKKELLDQVTYHQFLQEVVKLLTFSLEEQLKSPCFLVLLKSGNDYLTLSQKGANLKKIALSKIPDLFAKQGAFVHQDLSYNWLHLEVRSENIWLFFEQRDQETSDLIIRAFIEKYFKLIQMVRFLHLAQKSAIETSLDTNIQLQEKLFNSLEAQKKKTSRLFTR